MTLTNRNNITGDAMGSALGSALGARLGGYQTLKDWQFTSSESIRSLTYVLDTLQAALVGILKASWII